MKGKGKGKGWFASECIYYACLLFGGCVLWQCNPTGSIDRHALVSRHNIVLDHVDTMGSLTVGNGEFAFTVDVTGMQSFPEAYANGIALTTQAQWGWHTMTNPQQFLYAETLDTLITCADHQVSYATQSGEGRRGEAVQWYRSNPQRLHLGLLGLELLHQDGTIAAIPDLAGVHQELDLWSGIITSSFTFEGEPVEVTTLVLPGEDAVAFRIKSGLIRAGQLKIRLRFPFAANCHVCPGADWDHPLAHTSQQVDSAAHQAQILRILDSARYAVQCTWNDGRLVRRGPHEFILEPASSAVWLEATVRFSQEQKVPAFMSFRKALHKTQDAWRAFWESGGAVDFSQCTDPRAFELERRVILSQYLTRIQCAGSLPPQETGLTGNSWYGKFHLEMHWWHGVHFALWGRPEWLEKSLPWYDGIQGRARAVAQRQGYAGVRWPKMTGPAGISSPSSVGEFLIWQQPHPIYFAELMYRQHPDAETLEKYGELVFATADFMASFPCKNADDGKYHLQHPLIPAQEIFPALETDDPAFELAYWRWGLQTALCWKERLGLPPDTVWQRVLDQLAPLPQQDGRYLPVTTSPDAYSNPDKRRDHPIVAGLLGMLPPTSSVDLSVMEKTYQTIKQGWQWETMWGWDFPLLAMAAARLDHPDDAVDWLLMDSPKNTYLVNGHNFQDQRLKIYLPGNGGLLTAVAMMAGGWDGSTKEFPGFPRNGQWNIQWEGLHVLP